jgi:hypothetical protein
MPENNPYNLTQDDPRYRGNIDIGGGPDIRGRFPNIDWGNIDWGSRDLPNIMDIINILGGPGGAPGAGTPIEPGPAEERKYEPTWLRSLLDYLGAGERPDWLMKMGGNIFGSAMQSRAQSQYNEELRRRTELMDRLGGEERERRDYYAQTLMPNLLRGTGFTGPQRTERMAQFPTSQV